MNIRCKGKSATEAGSAIIFTSRFWFQLSVSSIPSHNSFPLEDFITFKICCLQVERGHILLVHAAAGGVGSLLCQWANALGATVIGTVSTEEKAAQAKEDGCHHVINYKEEDFVARVNELTSGNGVHVVYDSVGKDTFLVIFNLCSLLSMRLKKNTNIKAKTETQT